MYINGSWAPNFEICLSVFDSLSSNHESTELMNK